MKIWLDDCRTPPQGFYWVKNLAELIELLENDKSVIEIMSFDHDLGEPDEEPSGYDIIKIMAEKYLDRWPEEIRVHSANPVGAKNIRCFDRNVRIHLLNQSP